MTNQFDIAVSELIQAAEFDRHNDVTLRDQIINNTLTQRQARVFLDALIARMDPRAAALKALSSPAYP